MKATGIVRRIDDLGRIVIPKELRKQMGITSGDPVEFFVNPQDGSICLAKYRPYGEKDWEQATRIAKAMLAHSKFALLNRYGEVMGDNCRGDKVVIDSMNYSKEIIIDGDTEGFLMALSDDVDAKRIEEVVKVIAVLFSEEG